MSSAFVLNASPLILLSKAGLLQSIGSLAKLWVVPDAVAAEFEIKRSLAPYVAELKTVSKVSLESCPQIHPEINRLKEVGLRIDTDLLTKVFKKIGE